MKNVNIRLVVLLGAFSIASIILFQVYWINYTFKISSTQFNQRVKIALYSVAERMADFNHTVLPYNPVNQVTSNYFIVNTATHIDAKILEHYLKTVFQQHNINLDCEYAIYNCETGEMTYGNYLTNGVEIPKNAGIHKFEKQKDLVYYFGVIFPGKTSYIVRSINIWIISSVIVIMALVFFAYAIFIILRQKRLSEIQKDFIDNMTHEFKTPISSIAIASHVLTEPDIGLDLDRLKKYAAIIIDQNLRLEKHVEKVLQIASLERSTEKLKLEVFDLHDVIRDVVDTITTFKVQVTADLHAEPSEIMADKHHLTNIIYNLLDNAVKYCGSSPEIHISTEIKGNLLILCVKDNGPGIDPLYLRRIFDKFFRIPSGNVHTVKGFGLGLYYVKRTVEYHRWKIKAESKPGYGTSIRIEINRKRNAI
ncbi:MAG: HAMP domain-containing sensor histidine kinase [Bacteroidetes bacterium]|nr:HAMP domain-containing sensor histidine kinase [Bacteroidota bacterium]